MLVSFNKASSIWLIDHASQIKYSCQRDLTWTENPDVWHDSTITAKHNLKIVNIFGYIQLFEVQMESF